MKLQNLLLLSLLLAFQLANAATEKIFNYKFHCMKDYNNSCSTLRKELVSATNSLSKILDSYSKVNFEVFVDDISKYRVNQSNDTLAVSLNKQFAPLNPKNVNVISPYPRAKKIKKALNLKAKDEVKDTDFILLLNCFKSNKKYLKSLKDDRATLITIELYEALYNLDKLQYPYNERQIDNSFNDLDISKMAITLLNVRHDLPTIEQVAIGNEEKYKKYYESNRFYETMKWKDTLIVKGKEYFPRKKYEYKRIVVIGDVHGDYEKFERVLRHAKLIDNNNNWIGTDSILVQMGDLTDRDSNFKDVVELIIKLRQQAREKGGIVYVLLGNHELYDMQAGYFMLAKTDFDNFGGILEREKAISMDGKYGEFLRKEMNVTMIVDDNLFTHAGLTYEFAKRGVDGLNNYVHEILSTVPSFDEILNDYYNNNKTHPLYTDPIFDMSTGPLWSKYYTVTPEEESCKELEKVLKITKAKRMIVGHVVQEYGKINSLCQNKLIFVDVGLTKCLGNFFGYVEILNNKKEIWARYR